MIDGKERIEQPWLGTYKLVFTRGISDQIAGDEDFSKFVWKSLLRFNGGDWGDVGAEAWKANDKALVSLKTGGWYGGVLGNYTSVFEMWDGDPYSVHTKKTIWIIRNTAEADGTQAITVLFPEEY
jgi:hypothetical protein